MMQVFVLCALLVGAYAELSRFDGYKVYRMIPTTDEQLEALRKIAHSSLDFDFWKAPSLKDAPVDIMVPPHNTAQFKEIANDLQINTQVYIEDVQQLIRASTPKIRDGGIREFGWTDYHTGAEINDWLKSLEQQYPNKVKIIVGGRSYEGRDIIGVKLSSKEGNKAVFIEGGIHAREWISPATVTYILNQLLTSNDVNVREIADSYDWYIFPSFNPDGYEYTHTHNRMWRKTRKPHGAVGCRGADPNRNWDFHWMDGGASSFSCFETYGGPSAFSEPETKSLSEFITSIQKDLIAYISFHSYSQLLLIPYGYSSQHLENFDELMEIGKKAASSLSAKYGTNYTVGNIVEVIYTASGGSMDWVKGTHHTPITYTYELRDTGRYGFILPPDQIIPSGEETLDSLVTIIQEAKARGY